MTDTRQQLIDAIARTGRSRPADALAAVLPLIAEHIEAEADRCVGRQHDQYLAGLYGAADLLRTLAATGEPNPTAPLLGPNLSWEPRA